ncbi:MAG: CRISPR-associated helicase Cas3' [Candidatus Paceibacterota bacterium]
MLFPEFFKIATGGLEPYPYQQRFAERESPPELLSVPTGVGKTATCILGWLWRRCFSEIHQRSTPRRLVICLPMRTLVEQTQDSCQGWINNLETAKSLAENRVTAHLLMGGEDATEWDEFPEREAILIGTQDMLLSRALNRGYGMSRYRWPMHFALMNNDCLWVLDETQLMGVGLQTSCQLAGLRAKLNVFGSCPTVWMSATLDTDVLATVDHPRPDPASTGMSLNADDRKHDRVRRLLEAKKPLAKSATSLDPTTSKSQYESGVAEEVIAHHRPGTLTLVVVNSVPRSQKLFASLQKALAKRDGSPDCSLIHSRFRPADRRKTQAVALDEATIAADGPGRIIVATQAIEAGVDISATTLFTELAPWSSMVQRFGRCNRRGVCGVGDNSPAAVYWLDIDTSDGGKSKLTLPYDAGSLDQAREQLELLDDVGPASLSNISLDQPQPNVQILRRKDLLDLFDTTPDLSGNDLDVSRYIRDTNDTDLQVYWRQWDLVRFPRQPPRPEIDSGVKVEDFPAPARDELCSVSIRAARDFFAKLKQKLAFCWDPLDQQWTAVGKSNIRPGMTVMLHTASGGYDARLGWTGDAKHQPQPVSPKSRASFEANQDDEIEGAGYPVNLTQHLRDLVGAVEHLREAITTADEQVPWDVLVTAARWHDVGKAHPAFQTAMRDFSSVTDADPGGQQLWAKSGERGMPRYRMATNAETDNWVSDAFDNPNSVRQTKERSSVAGESRVDTLLANEHVNITASPQAPESREIVLPRSQSRRGFRHELVSALAWLQENRHSDETTTENLVAYLIASHHGKVRLSIRSMPNEPRPTDSDVKFARGVWEGDEVPAVDLGNGQSSSEFKIVLDLMRLGESPRQGPSWLARMLALRDEYGPFRLAYLETLLRVSDWRASKAGAGA